MSSDIDALSVLPESWQDEILSNPSSEFFIERLSDYISMMNFIIDSGEYELLERMRNGEIMDFNQLKEFML